MTPAEAQALARNVAALEQVGQHIAVAAQSILEACTIAKTILDQAKSITSTNGHGP